MRSKFLCSLLLLSSIAVAQTPFTPPSNLAVQLSELDKIKLELITTKLQLAQAKADAIVKEGQALNAELQQAVIATEAKYPGYSLQQQRDGSFTLVAKPKAPEAPIKTTPKK